MTFMNHQVAFFVSYFMPRAIAKGYELFATQSLKEKVDHLSKLSPTLMRFFLVTLPDNGPNAAVICFSRVKNPSLLLDVKVLSVSMLFTIPIAKILEIIRLEAANSIAYLFPDRFQNLIEAIGPRDYYFSRAK